MSAQSAIAVVLEAHVPSTVPEWDYVRSRYLDRCRCGKVTGDEHGHAAHQAAVIAELPGVVILDTSFEWFVLKDGFFADNGTVVSGPHSTSDDAYRARNAIERVLDMREYYVDGRAARESGCRDD